MSTFEEDEASVAQNRPIDLYDIETPTVTYRVTSHPVDVEFKDLNDQRATYIAVPMSRGAEELAQDLTSRELTLYLPIGHPLVQRFAATGIPEHAVQVTHRRLQQVSGFAFQAWQGFAGGLSIQGRTASIRVPALTDDAMKIQLPVIAAQKQCNHRLGDRGCAPNPGGTWPVLGGKPGSGGPDLAAFTVQTTIAAQSLTGGVVTVVVASLNGNPKNWAAFGEVVHVTSKQRRLVLAQTETTITINAPLVGATVGDAVLVIAGCAHDIFACVDKFNNRVNYGGAPLMTNRVNPWVPAGLGVIQQV